MAQTTVTRKQRRQARAVARQTHGHSDDKAGKFALITAIVVGLGLIGLALYMFS